MKRLFLVRLLAAGILAVASMQSYAAIIVTGLNMFRDIRGDNNVGIGSGDRIQYGGNVQGGSAGAFLSATYPPTGFIDAAQPCGPITVNLNLCSNSTAYNAGRIAQPWNFTFTKAGETPLAVTGPALTGFAPGAADITFAVPHPNNVTISGSGATPTISWTLPAGYTPDGLRVQILDRSRISLNGSADVIYTTAVSPNATSFILPTDLGQGRSLTLGGNYAINFQVVETRNNVVFTNNNAQIISRSNSWFNFTPLNNNAPPNVHLPQVSGGVFHFNVSNVGPNSVTFIDPIVAVGYDYQIGVGDPNFASVLLPTGIGDNLFDLFLFNLGLNDYVDSGIDLVGGSQFFFGPGGVNRFRILGIETSAGIDPNNVTAFITGLTFVAAGDFTGTMTPLTIEIPGAAVPLPGTLALLALGLAAFGFSRRKLLA